MPGMNYNEIIRVLEAAVWPVVSLIIFLLLLQEIKTLFRRFACADEMSVKIGSLSMEAKAFHEMKNTIETGFNDGAVSKEELSALFELKQKSIHAALQRALAGHEVRSGERTPIKAKIRIRTGEGQIIEGETLDISDAGISFRSKERLQFFDVVTIEPVDTRKTPANSLLEKAKIVRVELSKGSFHYGATVAPEPMV